MCALYEVALDLTLPEGYHKCPMPDSCLISASILSADFAHLAEQISIAENAGVDWIHIDVMDGHFVPNLTMGPMIIETINRITALPLDVHLMIESPDRSLDQYAQAGADWITVHIETCPHIHRTLQHIRELGCRPGVTLNPGTPLATISEVISEAEMVLVMSVNPGFSAQRFIPATTEKISRLRKMIDNSGAQTLIEVDGGVNSDTVREVVEAGADVIVAASAIFGHPAGIRVGVESLRQNALGIHNHSPTAGIK